MRLRTILPGSVKDILCFGTWKDHDILVYLSGAGELIIMEDTKLLQIITGVETDFRRADFHAAFNPKTGCLVYATASKLTVYEGTELFGRPPRWEKIVECSEIPQCSGVAWIGDYLLAITSPEGRFSVYDVKMQQISAQYSTGYKQLASNLDCRKIILFTTNCSDFLVGQLSETDDSEQPLTLLSSKSYSTGAQAIKRSWFITSSLLATLTSSALFIWNTNSQQLVVSIPCQEDESALVLPTMEESVYLQFGSARSILSVKAEQSPSLLELESATTQVDSNTRVVAASTTRVYALVGNTIKIYAHESGSLAKIGVISGINRSKGLNLLLGDTGTIFAGSNIQVADEFVNVTDQEVLFSAYIDTDRVAIVCEDSKMRYFVKLVHDKDVKWEVELTNAAPRSVGSYKANDGQYLIYVVTASGKFEILDSNNGRKKEETALPLQSVDQAAAQSNRIVTLTNDHIQTWDVSSSPQKAMNSMSYKGSIVDKISISESLLVSVLYTKSKTCKLDIWDSKQSHPSILNLDLGTCCPISAAWSSSHSQLLAVLTTHSLSVYGIIPKNRGGIVCLAAMGSADQGYELLSAFSPKATLSWSPTSQFIWLFNGRQIVSFDLSLDLQSDKVVDQYNLRTDGVSSILSLHLALSGASPIYHPANLLLCLEALRPQLASYILESLIRQFKFADTNDDGTVVFLHYFLNITKFDDNLVSSNTNTSVERQIEVERLNELQRLLDRHQIAGMTQKEKQDLQILVSIYVHHPGVDAYALCALALSLLAQNSQSNARSLNSKALAYAWFSETKSQLRAIMADMNLVNRHELLLWLDLDALKAEFEQNAKRKFAEDRDPTKVTLQYLALRNVAGLQTLWRIASGHSEREKTLKLLKNDFTTSRWQTAAHKNAYALLSKHRPEYAAAFFLLGDSVKDCVQICADKLGNMDLAIAIARVYDGDSGPGLKFLRSRYFEDISESEEPFTFIWTQFWINWMIGDHEAGLEKFVTYVETDLSVVLLYSQLGGKVTDGLKQSWSEVFNKWGIPRPLSAAVLDPLSTKPLLASTLSLHRVDGQENTSTEAPSSSSNPPDSTTDLENRAMPAHLKPAPTEIQLEPDMSAFGF